MRAGWLLAMLVVMFGVGEARAQESGPPDAASRRVEDTLAAILAAHRSGVVAQVVSVRVSAPGGRERVSRVEVLTDPGDAAAGRARRVSLRLGRVLHVEAEGAALRAVSPRNSEAAYVADLPGEVDAAALASRFPPIPVPHVAWAFGGATWAGGTVDVPPLGVVTIESMTPSGRRGLVMMGRNERGAVRLEVEGTALRRVTGPMPGTDLEADLTCRDVAPWGSGVDVAGRRLVSSPAGLRPLPAELQPGALVSGLGLMRPDLTPISVAEAMAAQAAEPTEAGEGPMLGVLVMYLASTPGAEDGTLLAVGSMRTLKRTLDRRRLTGETRTPRLFVQPVAVFDLAGFSPAAARQVGEAWSAAGERGVWTSAGQALLDRFDRGATALAVVVDAEMTLLGVAEVGLDAAAADATLAEVRAIIEEKSEPK